MRSQPSSQGGRGAGRVVGVPVEEDRAAQQHLPVITDADLDPVERATVVDASAAGLGHAVGLHEADAFGLGGGAHLRSQRAAADEDGVEAGQGRELGRVVQQPAQLRRDEGDVAARAGHGRDGCGEGSGLEDGLGAGDDRAEEHLQSGDVRRREVEHPLPGAAEPGVGGARGGAQGGAGERDRLGAACGAGGAQHERVGVGVAGVPGAEQREDLRRAAGDRVERGRDGLGRSVRRLAHDGPRYALPG